MTKLEVEIVSIETIKPSSPTPPHLRSFKFSLIDQIFPIFYHPLILYYSRSTHGDAIAKTEELKISLSKTLVRFYPLAGRIKENHFVDCKDHGVLCLVAKVGCFLSDFLKQPQLDELERFLPLGTNCTEPPELAVQLAIQINIFSCGGIAIGVSASHKIIDGSTLSGFLKCWAAIVTGKWVNKTEAVDCVAASLFPEREEFRTHPLVLVGSSSAEEEKICTRRFVFNAEAISKLKVEAKSSEAVTSNQALFGFIWKCLVNASQAASGSQQPSVLSIAVDLRRRMEPPLPEEIIGNIVCTAFASYKPMKMELDLQDFVSLVKNSISEINTKYVQTLVGDEGFVTFSKFHEKVAEIYTSGKRIYELSSRRNLGLNEVDFGWGKPTWISFKVTERKNAVMLIESREGDGDGVEVWVTLSEDEMSVLETDLEWLAFASLNPGISCFLHD